MGAEIAAAGLEAAKTVELTIFGESIFDPFRRTAFAILRWNGFSPEFLDLASACFAADLTGTGFAVMATTTSSSTLYMTLRFLT